MAQNRPSGSFTGTQSIPVFVYKLTQSSQTLSTSPQTRDFTEIIIIFYFVTYVEVKEYSA